ncbi:MAG: hypothetical protein K2X99_05330 [Gemmatimonadaceae bacterium]|nr:hypothetical protein [Gemmatimonadaceae bacterium]
MTRRYGWSLIVSLALVTSNASAQRVFKGHAPVEITIVTDLKTLLRIRDSTQLRPYAAAVTVPDSSGTRTLSGVLRARGHYRRQSRNCDFPPIRLEFAKGEVTGSFFQGNRKTKITTNCRPGNPEYEQYVLHEYGVWRMYEELTDWSFQVRLARITYKDVKNATPPITSWAFLVEDEDEVAERNNARVREAKGARFEELEQNHLGLVSLFEYLVGNTDWSIGGLHNIRILLDSASMRYVPVAYDWDFSGVVRTRYATVDPRLPIRNVTDRLYRGDCRPTDQWTWAFDRFKKRRAAMDAVWDSIPALDPARVKRTKDYLAEFWPMLEKPDETRRVFARSCEKLGN